MLPSAMSGDDDSSFFILKVELKIRKQQFSGLNFQWLSML